MSQHRALAVTVVGLLLSACPKPRPELSFLVISPDNARIANGDQLQFVVSGVYSDGSTRVMTSEVGWNVDDALVAQLSDTEPGLVMGLSPGDTYIRAHYDGIATSRRLTVTEATVRSLEVTPAQPVVPLGLPVELQVFAVHTDLSVENVTASALFLVDDPTLCSISNARITAKSPGKTTATVSYQGVLAHFDITVTAASVQSLSVDPSMVSLPAGLSQRFVATALLSDHSTLDVTLGADWTSSATAIAFATNAGADKGLVLARTKGTATIRAGLEAFHATAALTVTDATLTRLDLTPGVASTALGTTTQFRATGVFSDGTSQDVTAQVTWAVSNPAIASLDSATPGLLRGLSVGTTPVQATLGSKSTTGTLTVTAALLTRIDLTPTGATVAKGTTATLTATGVFSDGTTQNLTEQATWSTADTTIATASNAPNAHGVVLGRSEGQTEVRAQLAQLTGQLTLTVTAALLTEVQVTPAQATLPAGTSARLTATGLFSDGSTQDLTNQAGWSSADPTRVSVTNGSMRGTVLGLARGSSLLTATVQGKSGSAQVTVTDAVLVSLSVSPAPLTLARGTQSALTAMAVYSDNSSALVTSQVTWSSSDSAIVSVSNSVGQQGAVHALSAGTADVVARLGTTTASTRVTVTPAQLTSIELAPSSTTLAAGLSQPFTATGTYTDSTTQDLTTAVTWASSTPSVATISNANGSRGLATALTAGSTTLTATLAGRTGTATLTVTPARLVSMSITPPTLSVSRGTVANLTVRGTYTDGASIDLTQVATWTSTDALVATISNASGGQGQLHAAGVGSATITAQLSSVTATASVTVTPALLQAIELTPAAAVAPVGTTVPYTATGRYSDGTTQNVTAQATFTSTDTLIASVSNAPGTEGRAQALHQGNVTISASYGGRTGSTGLAVTAAALASIAITPSPPHLAPGTPLQLHATGTWTDGSTQDLTTQATWASSDTAVAQMSNVVPTQGRLLAIGSGTATLTATFTGISGMATVTVSNATLLAIDLAPSPPSAPAGLSLRLSATGVFSDGSTQDLTDFVSWSSADAMRVSVSNSPGSQGLASALLVGTTTISATALGVTGSANFTVTSALLSSLSLTPATATLPRGTSLGWVATGTFTDGSTQDLTTQVTWSSSDPTVAVVSNALGTRGVATALATGNTTVSASLTGTSASANLTVSPAALVSIDVTPVNPSMPLGLGVSLTAMGTYTDGTTQDLTNSATWTAANTGIATVSNSSGSNGLVSSVAVGTTTLTASLGGKAGSTQVSVTVAQLVAVGVTPSGPVIPLGLTQQLTATGVYTDGSTQDLTALASWLSSDAAVAPVSNSPRGRVSAAAQGTSTVTATYGGKSGATLVTVSAAVLQQVQLTPPTPSLPAGLTLQLTATGIYSDSTTQDLTGTVTWSSGNTGIAHVSNATGAHGLLTGIAVGSTTLSATEGGITGTVTVTVTPALLQQVQVTPANASVPRGVPQRFTATGLYSNGTTQDLTSTTTWASSDGSRVAISNATGSEGRASTLNVGTVTITATSLGISGTTPFSVTAAVLTSIALVPGNSTVPLGSVRFMQVIGTYTDGTTQNLTSQASFASSDPTVVSISNAPGSLGLATTTNIGSVTISATALGLSATTSMTVTQAALAAIDITPSNGSTALGYSRQFIAIGTYTDGTTMVLTTQVTWASSDATKAFISNGTGTKGLLSPVAPATVTITATWSGVTGTTSHTVTPAVLVSLTVTPPSFTVGAAATQQVTAMGTFSDGSSQDLTGAVTWSSSSPSVAQVSNAGGSQGLVTGIASGQATISATSGLHVSTATATVP